MRLTRLIQISCVSALALGSAVALAQNAPPDATGEAAMQAVEASAEAAAPPPSQPIQIAPSSNPSPSSSESVEDAPVDVPASSQSDWTADINLDAEPKSAVSSNGYVRQPKPRKRLSDAGEDTAGSGSWGQGVSPQAAQAELLARAQRRERPLDPVKRSELSRLSRVMGALHALRVACAGREDQTYRSRMATMLDLEAPNDGGLRDPLVDAFNGGFQAYGRGATGCPTDARTQEATLGKEGYTLARTLSARYRPQPKPVAALPPAAAPRQVQVAAARQPSPAPAKAPAKPQAKSGQPSWNPTAR